MMRSTEEERLACPGKVKGGAGLAVGRQGCGSQLVAAIPRRMLLHVPRFIGNNGSARSTCGAQGGGSGVPSLTARPRGAPGGPAPPPKEVCTDVRDFLFSCRAESFRKSGSGAVCALHGFNGILGVVDSFSCCTIIKCRQWWHSLITGDHPAASASGRAAPGTVVSQLLVLVMSSDSCSAGVLDPLRLPCGWRRKMEPRKGQRSIKVDLPSWDQQ